MIEEHYNQNILPRMIKLTWKIKIIQIMNYIMKYELNNQNNNNGVK